MNNIMISEADVYDSTINNVNEQHMQLIVSNLTQLIIRYC